jgi:hypothetical protein
MIQLIPLQLGPVSTYLTSFVSPAILVVVGVLGASLAWLLYFPARNVTIRPVRASKFQPELVPKHDIDTIVIGSGSGGCAAANILAQSGHRVLLLEQHYRTGGCTHTFREEGCEWDTGTYDFCRIC